MQGLPLFAARRRNIFLYVVAVAVPVVFLLTMLSQRVFAQNTYVITDGDQVIVHTTNASDPAEVLDEAGVIAQPDEYYTTQTEEGVYDITVRRNDTVTVQYGDNTLDVPIQDETVGALLERIGYSADAGYVTSSDLTAIPQDGMIVTVDHVTVNEEIYTVELPYKVYTVKDPYLPEGEEQILRAGVVGQELRTADVEYRNAVEISRSIKSRETLRTAQAQIVAVGTGELVGQTEEMPLIGDGVIVLPSGEVLTYYAQDTYSATAYTQYDSGCDTITACGTPVRWGVVAVDPSMIPYGTRMFIVNSDGSFVYGVGTAEDCGSAIQGKRLDLYMPTLSEAFDYGRQPVTVYFLGDANWRIF